MTKCFDLIRQASMNGMGKDYVVFTVPFLMQGEPLYQYEECLKYIREHLKAHGFKRYRLSPGNILYISWAPDPTDPKEEPVASSSSSYTTVSNELVINYNPNDKNLEETVNKAIRQKLKQRRK